MADNTSAAIADAPEIRYDGALINALTKMGTIKDKSEWTRPGITSYFAKKDLEDAYKIPVFQRICGAHPESAIEKGWEITLTEGGKKNIVDATRDYSDRLDVPGAFCQAQVWANLYRGSAIVIVADDGEPWSKPINTKKLKTITKLSILDCHKIRPLLDGEWNAIEPSHYQITLPYYLEAELRKMGYKPEDITKVHSDRIIRFDGIVYPNDMMLENGGWGGSLIETIWEAYASYATGIKSLANMLNDFSIFIYKMKGLAKLVRSNKSEDIQAHLSLLQLMVSVMGGMAIDAEGEDVNFATRNFAGADGVTKELRDAFIGATGITHDKLFGESPSGLGATGESEEKNWSAEVGRFQKFKWLKKLRQIYRLIFLCKDGPTKGNEPKGWSIKFFPIIQESQQDVVASRSTQAQTDNVYISAGVVLPEEIRKARFGGAEYSIETTLDDKLWEENKKAQEEQNQFGGFGDFGGGMEGEPPPEEAIAPETPEAQAEAPIEEPTLDSLEAEARRKWKVPQARWSQAWLAQEIGIRSDSLASDRERLSEILKQVA